MSNLENTYWNESGKYQGFVKELEDRIPGIGYTSNVHVNLFIAMSHLYYDAYNNGGCNIEDCYMRDYRRHIKPYLGDKVDPEAFIYGNSVKMEAMMDLAIEHIKEKHLEFPVYSCWANHTERAISMVEPVGIEDEKSAWFKITFGDMDDLREWAKGYRDVSDNFVKSVPTHNRYYKENDGWFDYFVNADTGEKKFKLDPTDICVERNIDDFSRPGRGSGDSLDNVIQRCEKASKGDPAVCGRDPDVRSADTAER